MPIVSALTFILMPAYNYNTPFGTGQVLFPLWSITVDYEIIINLF